jgi:ABC-type uncharacterized transport system auxiliary subunit
MIGKSIAPALLLSLALTGCGSVPPAPVDHFYRLQAPTQAATATGANIEIRRVQADSLYAERPIVYSEAGNLRQLRQYHYHLWLYPPAQMVRDDLRIQLQKANIGNKTALFVDARIVAFDRIVSGAGSTAQAALEITVSSSLDGKPVLIDKRYQATQASSDNSITAFVVAMEGALAHIYAELQRDIEAKAAK